MLRNIIDTHLHLDAQAYKTADAAVEALNTSLAENNVVRGVVLQLEIQGWPLEEVAVALSKQDRLVGFANIDPFQKDALVRLQQSVCNMGYVGLKLHPRIHNYSIDSSKVHELIGTAGELGVPVLIDAFPDGEALLMGFDPVAFFKVAKKCSNTRIIIAHFGGHYCMDMMMLAKRVSNLYLDISYSLLYYNGSSVPRNILYCCKSMNYEKIFYGSDYPDRPIDVTLDRTLDLFMQENIDASNIDKLMYQNAKEFFRWDDI